MKWSPAIAGKRGKCKCGATIEVPRSIEPPAEEDRLGALDIPLQPVEESSQAAPASAPLSYATRPARAGATGVTARKIWLSAGVMAIVLLLIVLAVIWRAAARSQPVRAAVPTGRPSQFASAPSAAPVRSPSPTPVVSQPVPAAAVQPSGRPIAAAPPPPVPAEIAETNRDRFVWNRVHGGNPAIRKLAAWKTSSDFTDKDAPLARFLDHLSSLGTGEITVDTTETQKGITRIYIELPATVQERDACFTALKEFVSNTPQVKIPRQIPNTDRFVEIWLGQFDRFK